MTSPSLLGTDLAQPPLQCNGAHFFFPQIVQSYQNTMALQIAPYRDLDVTFPFLSLHFLPVSADLLLKPKSVPKKHTQLWTALKPVPQTPRSHSQLRAIS